MDKHAEQRIDLYSDAGHARLRELFTTFPGVRDFVKSAEFEDYREQVPDSAFAWPSERRFPVHTPEHAALSRLYAKQASAPLPVIRAIEEACEMLDVPEDIFQPVRVKEAALSSDECLFPDLGTYPIRNAGEVKQAEQRLLPQADKLSTEERTSVFAKLAGAAKIHGVKLAGLSLQYAGETSTDPGVLRRALQLRANVTKVGSVVPDFEALANAVAKDPRALRDNDLRHELVAKIAELDQRAQLDDVYFEHLPPPDLLVFNTTKVASADDIDLGDTSVSAQALSQLGPSFFADLLGSDILREIAPSGTIDQQQLADVVRTLPANLKQELGEAVKSTGI